VYARTVRGKDGGGGFSIRKRYLLIDNQTGG
jgi:hypothetical protein